jgi:8-oxo-dGTP pyrophosphatase MutT (NUDIX family)
MVIIDTPVGILIVSEVGKRYSLPGGNARKGESRRKAAIRELREETGLKAIDCVYLFEYSGSRIHKDVKGGHFKTVHKVFLVKTTGIAKAKKEIIYFLLQQGKRKLALFNQKNNRKILQNQKFYS